MDELRVEWNVQYCAVCTGDELQQWIVKEGWSFKEDGRVFVANQEGHIKSKNITEKIDFDSECM